MQAEKLELQRVDQKLLSRNLDSKEKLDKFNVAKEMLSVGGDFMTDLERRKWFRIMSECATAIAVEENAGENMRTPSNSLRNASSSSSISSSSSSGSNFCSSSKSSGNSNGIPAASADTKKASKLV